MAGRLWHSKVVEDMGRLFWKVSVEGEVVARHTDKAYADLHVDAMNAIANDPDVAAAVEREAMRRIGD